ARAAPGSSCEIAERYVATVTSERHAEAVKFFAPDAKVIAVEDRVLSGPDIAAFYERTRAQTIPISFVDSGADCFMELAGAVPGQPGTYKLNAVDHFTLDANRRIARLVIYFRISPAA